MESNMRETKDPDGGEELLELYEQLYTEWARLQNGVSLSKWARHRKGRIRLGEAKTSKVRYKNKGCQNLKQTGAEIQEVDYRKGTSGPKTWTGQSLWIILMVSMNVDLYFTTSN
jgi:hypothetical protein